MRDNSGNPNNIITFLFTIKKHFALDYQLQQELEEAKEDAANARVDLSIALQQIADLQLDQQSNIDQQAALATHFKELTLEVETTKSSSQAFFEAAVDSKNALRVTLMNLQVRHGNQEINPLFSKCKD